MNADFAVGYHRLDKCTVIWGHTEHKHSGDARGRKVFWVLFNVLRGTYNAFVQICAVLVVCLVEDPAASAAWILSVCESACL